jgi:perosamine synthetase
MTELQGAIGVGQVADFAAHVAARREIRGWYQAALADRQDLVWQQSIAGSQPAWWLNTVLLPQKVSPAAVAAALLDHGIETRPSFVPLHRLPMYQQDPARFVNAEIIAEGAISLPTYRGLTQADVQTICDALLEILR